MTLSHLFPGPGADLAGVRILFQIEQPVWASMQCLLDKWMGDCE